MKNRNSENKLYELWKQYMDLCDDYAPIEYACLEQFLSFVANSDGDNVIYQ